MYINVPRITKNNQDPTWGISRIQYDTYTFDLSLPLWLGECFGNSSAWIQVVVSTNLHIAEAFRNVPGFWKTSGILHRYTHSANSNALRLQLWGHETRLASRFNVVSSHPSTLRRDHDVTKHSWKATDSWLMEVINLCGDFIQIWGLSMIELCNPQYIYIYTSLYVHQCQSILIHQLGYV